MRHTILIAVGLLLASPAWSDLVNDIRDCDRGTGVIAINACTRLLQSKRFSAPRRGILYFNRGAEYDALKQYHRAIQDYTSVLRLNPKDAGAYYNRGADYYKLKQYHRAIQDFSGALRLNPSDANYYSHRGSAHFLLKQCRRAIQDYSAALRLDPKNARTYSNRGDAYRCLKQYRRAIQEHNVAVRLNPNLFQSYYNRGYIYGVLKQYRRAIQDFAEAIRISPKFADAYGNRGWSHEKLGHKLLAIRDYRMLLRLRPGHRVATAGLKRLGVEPPPASSVSADYEGDVKICVEGNGRAQINACSRVLRADKFDARARAIMYSNRGASYANLKQYRRALKDYYEALRLNPRDAHVYINRGTTYHGLKQSAAPFRTTVRQYASILEFTKPMGIAAWHMKNLAKGNWRGTISKWRCAYALATRLEP
ncbi:MAG: tetratricopeptide repeat protein [Alphaproteobacteria bacterium]|nr:tetratricopeptide repeat protein [Alphaproteobacteria bacterium]